MSWVADKGRAQALEMGVVPVPEAARIMSVLSVLRRGELIGDLILTLAHPETISIGVRHDRRKHPEGLLVPPGQLENEGIELVRTVRGGGITYHWPGQVVCYPIVALGPRDRDIPRFMAKLEAVAAAALKSFGVEAKPRRDTPAHIGLWVDGKKLVSMGVRVDHWVTSFGFAVNVGAEPPRARYVVPCGIAGARFTTLEEIIGAAPPRAWVVKAVTGAFSDEFGLEVSNAGPALLSFIGSGGPPRAAEPAAAGR